MTEKFKNYNQKLICKGIIGDGCGGDRTFYIDNNTLYAYDDTTKTSLKLLGNLENIISIEKRKCIIYLTNSKNNILEFDLSTI
jgi:hypothetical protein